MSNPGGTRRRLMAFMKERGWDAGLSDAVLAQADLGELLTSLEHFELLAFIEETFGVVIDNEALDPRDFQTIEAVEQFIEGQR